MINKEMSAAVIMSVTYLILPDVGLNKPQVICLLIALFGSAWSLITYIEEIAENIRKRSRRAKRTRVLEKKKAEHARTRVPEKKEAEYVLYERYHDGTLHRVPMPR